MKIKNLALTMLMSICLSSLAFSFAGDRGGDKVGNGPDGGAAQICVLDVTNDGFIACFVKSSGIIDKESCSVSSDPYVAVFYPMCN